MKDTPDIKHPDYLDSEQEREMYLSLIAGTKKVRAAHYLPQFPLESAKDYETRVNTATLLNVTKKTRDTLVGLTFQKEIKHDDKADKSIQDLAENIDNKGNHLNVFARSVFTDSFDGWACILADAPGTKASDLGQQKQLGIRPYLTLYKAANVTHWDYQINPVSKKKELSLIIFAECTNEKKGKFAVEKVNRLRAFYLENGRVYWELWREQKKKESGENEWVIEVPQTLMDKLSEIPVSVVGKLGQCPPLTDLAYLNIKYLQKESDYDAIIHKTCVPIPYTTGIEAGEVGKAQAGGVMWHLPKDATLAFAEVAGSSIEKARTNLEDLKQDMSWMGLRMLMPQVHTATATEAVIDQIQDTSELQVMATQLKDAIELSLGHLAILMGMEKEKAGSIELGCSWDQMVLSIQDIQTLNNAVNDGNYPLEYFLWHLEKAGKFPPDGTVEDALDKITEEVVEMRPIKDARQFNEEEEESDTEEESAGAVPGGQGRRRGEEVSQAG